MTEQSVTPHTLINRDTLGILGDDILHSLVSLCQKGIGQVRSCRERWNGDIDADKVSPYFYRDIVVP